MRRWEGQAFRVGSGAVTAPFAQVHQHGSRVDGILFQLADGHGDGGDRDPVTAVGTGWQVRTVGLQGEATQLAIATGEDGEKGSSFHLSTSRGGRRHTWVQRAGAVRLASRAAGKPPK